MLFPGKIAVVSTTEEINENDAGVGESNKISYFPVTETNILLNLSLWLELTDLKALYHLTSSIRFHIKPTNQVVTWFCQLSDSSFSSEMISGR